VPLEGVVVVVVVGAVAVVVVLVAVVSVVLVARLVLPDVVDGGLCPFPPPRRWVASSIRATRK